MDDCGMPATAGELRSDCGLGRGREAKCDGQAVHHESVRADAERDVVPEIYQVVIECRHEREQRAVFERMRGEGYRCRVLTL